MIKEKGIFIERDWTAQEERERDRDIYHSKSSMRKRRIVHWEEGKREWTSIEKEWHSYLRLIEYERRQEYDKIE